MLIRPNIRLMLILFVIVALAGCSKSYEWNQNLTVNIATPDGIKSGSSVVNIATECVTALFNPDGKSLCSPNVTGEATVVDLGSGHYLFALLQGEATDFAYRGSAAYLAELTLWPDIKKLNNGVALAQGAAYVSSLPSGTATTLQPREYPALVTFDDVNDPKSVKLVDIDDLDAVFGCSAQGALNADTAPWRKAGKTWRVWRRHEAWRLSREQAGPLAGFSPELSSILVKVDIEYEGLVAAGPIETGVEGPKFSSETERQHYRDELAKHYTQNQYEQYHKVQGKLFVELLGGHQMDEFAGPARDTGKDCYKIKSIRLEMTNEKVTEGVVGRVLRWMDAYWDNGFNLSGKDCSACLVGSKSLADLMYAGQFKVRQRNDDFQ